MLKSLLYKSLGEQKIKVFELFKYCLGFLYNESSLLFSLRSLVVWQIFTKNRKYYLTLQL